MIDDVSVPPSDLVLDPFSYVPDMASSIAGLGGEGRPAEGNYAFHTPYVEAADGMAQFSIEFDGLTATKGTLNLRVHMLSSDSPHARLATAERVALNRLVLADGRHQVRFESFHGMSYALYGGIIGDTDAAARSARVVLDRPADPNMRRNIATEARNTEYGTAARPVPHLISLQGPILAAPVTQFATEPQMREPVARGWIDVLALGNEPAEKQWRSAYVLQALSVYGMLQPGARGLGLGCEDGPVVRALAARGVAVEVAPIGSESISPDLANYDFLWTDGAGDRRGTVAAGERFLEETLGCLRPGGIAVHVVRLDPGEQDRGLAFQRGHIERLCIVLISRGHDVAEFRVDRKGLLRSADGFSACGIVCRKAMLRE